MELALSNVRIESRRRSKTAWAIGRIPDSLICTCSHQHFFLVICAHCDLCSVCHSRKTLGLTMYHSVPGVSSHIARPKMVVIMPLKTHRTRVSLQIPGATIAAVAMLIVLTYAKDDYCDGSGIPYRGCCQSLSAIPTGIPTATTCV